MFRVTGKFVLRSMQRQLNINRLPNVHRCLYHSLFINPPHDEVPELTTSRLIEIFATKIGQAKEYSSDGISATEKQRQLLMELLPSAEDALPPRSMKNSFVTAVVPLKTRPEIRERYVSTGGKVRIGRILEDMDVFAVYSCFKHILNPKSVGKQNPYSVVTALVDSIHVIKDNMKSSEDVRLSGHVTYTGRSSMEVCIIVDQKDENGIYQKFFDAVFLMVARDPMNKGSAKINPLVAETKEEEEFLRKGIARQQLRKQQEEENIFKKPPNEDERLIVHDSFINKITSTTVPSSKVTAVPSSKKVRMKTTVMKTVLICQPENRNRYNKIFGGFIMRNAYELAFASALIYGKKRPRIIFIDDIKFHIPVEIGAILRFRSHVGYVEKDFVHTVVVAETVNPRSGEISKSNEFHFTFQIPREDSDEPIPEVDFETYEEAIHYLNSRRHFKHMMNEFGSPSAITY